MKNKKFLLIGLYSLVLVAILGYAVSMVIKFETSPDFEEFKFNATVDEPYEKKQGKYVSLRVNDGEWAVSHKKSIFKKNEGYAVITKDQNGFARVVRLQKSCSQLKEGESTVKIRQIYANNFFGEGEISKYTFSWPFDRFYLNELDAPELEKGLKERGTPVILKVKIFRDGSFTVSGLEKP